MNDEQLKQRIQYLVEHGGLWDDPLNSMRRDIRIALTLAGAASVLTVVDILIDVI